MPSASSRIHQRAGLRCHFRETTPRLGGSARAETSYRSGRRDMGKISRPCFDDPGFCFGSKQARPFQATFKPTALRPPVPQIYEAMLPARQRNSHQAGIWNVLEVDLDLRRSRSRGPGAQTLVVWSRIPGLLMHRGGCNARVFARWRPCGGFAGWAHVIVRRMRLGAVCWETHSGGGGGAADGWRHCLAVREHLEESAVCGPSLRGPASGLGDAPTSH